MINKIGYIGLLVMMVGLSSLLAIKTEKLTIADLESTKRIAANLVDSCLNVFRLKLLTVEGLSAVTESELKQRADVEVGEYFWNVLPYNLRTRLLELPWIDEVNFSWDLQPLHLHLQVTEATPWIVGEFKDRSVLISTSRKILLEKISSDDYPELIKLKSVEEYSVAEEKIKNAASILRALEMSATFPVFELKYITFNSDSGIRLVPVDSSLPEVLVNAKTLNEAEDALNRYIKVKSEIEKEVRHVKEIDLRFAAQAVLRN